MKIHYNNYCFMEYTMSRTCSYMLMMLRQWIEIGQLYVEGTSIDDTVAVEGTSFDDIVAVEGTSVDDIVAALVSVDVAVNVIDVVVVVDCFDVVGDVALMLSLLVTVIML